MMQIVPFFSVGLLIFGLFSSTTTYAVTSESSTEDNIPECTGSFDEILKRNGELMQCIDADNILDNVKPLKQVCRCPHGHVCHKEQEFYKCESTGTQDKIKQELDKYDIGLGAVMDEEGGERLF